MSAPPLPASAAGAPEARRESAWLSILLPVHDVGEYLDACIASVVDQGIEGVEIVCVDDASPGADAARLESWRTRHPQQVRVITHARNRGVAAARNTLLDNATGRYVWFVDPDDLVEPGALAALRAIVDADAPDLVLCDFRTFASAPPGAGGETAAPGSRRAHVHTFDPPPDAPPGSRAALVGGLFRSGQMHAWTKIVRRAAWPDHVRFPEGRVFEDLALFPRLALAIDTFHDSRQVWVAYRQREGSLLATLSAARIDDWTLALSGYADELRAAALGTGIDFEVAHFSARTLLRAIRRHRRLPSSADDGAAIARYVARWRDASPLDASALSRAYLARGRIGRWLQLRWTLWRWAR
jgi:glycosyltransferase involved in cell wall biosynthesis